MMVMNTGSSTANITTSPSATTAAADTSSTSSRQVLSKNAALRRRRTKGSAGVALGTNYTSNGISSAGDNDTADNNTLYNSNNNNITTTIEVNSRNKNTNNARPDPSGLDAAGNVTTMPNSALSLSSSTSQQLQQSSSSIQHGSNEKPCHAARLALLCCQNAVRMGSRTQLGLCPPGRGRRELKAALRQKNNRSNRAIGAGSLQKRSAAAGLPTFPDIGGYYGVDKLVGSEVLNVYAAEEESFLNSNVCSSKNSSTNSFKVYDDESDEDASSGDDDDLVDLKQLLLVDEPIQRLSDEEKKYSTLKEPLFTPIGSENVPNVAGVGGPMGCTIVGKLPFNRRKIRYFDSISARDTIAARNYLRQELQKTSKREFLLLAQHLKRTQRLQRRQLKEKRGQPLDANDLEDPESSDEFLPSCVSKWEEQMTPSVAAALVIESLEMNPLESIEGMSKCYEGIVAAGVALLESSDPAMSPTINSGGNHVTRSEIMAALTPLLITSLEQISGDVVILLAKLRRMCGTTRYQRRFVQRVAPSLIRPPRGAMWCLRHQNDMEPILAAAELIFDSAFEVFSKGWYDRGQLLLADSKRAETLSAAAMQLKNLSSTPHENLTLELGHGGWRSNKFKSGKDATKGGNEPLAEWEVIAVDRQIRVSISNIISMDWSKVVIHSREAALSTASYHHRNRQSNRRPSVLLQTATSGDMSPKNSVGSSPGRQLTPRNSTSTVVDEVENLTNVSLVQDTDQLRESSSSPVPTNAVPPMPLSPPPPNRNGMEDTAQVSNIFPPSELTPRRSPQPKGKEYIPESNTASSVASSPASPKRIGSATTTHGKESISNVPETVVPAGTPQSGGDVDRTPLSPLSAGTAIAVDSVPQRPISSASSVSSSVTGITGITGNGTQMAHYRMLTSTAAERKRTVAACRALRAQITRFEEAFIALHGRPPKGATERAPLATTYAQYREWKRAIRADAACRIQALFRGANTRWKLLRSDDPTASRVVLARAGIRSSIQCVTTAPPPGQDSVLKELSISTEIEENRTDGVVLSGVIQDRYSSQAQTTSQGRSPQWGNHAVRRRQGSGSETFTGNSIPKPMSSTATSLGSKSSAELTSLSLSELQARKRDLKQQLKQYDMNFARRHGRMPVKAEKEPIRHLYENYNALKSQITLMEQDGRGNASPVAPPQSTPAMLAQRTVSPVGSDSEESGPRRPHSRGNRNPSFATGQTTSQDLAALRAEKGKLHQMLRSYEKDFYKEHQRQVSSFADIRPVASQYRRYKEIKKAIAALQSGERGER